MILQTTSFLKNNTKQNTLYSHKLFVALLMMCGILLRFLFLKEIPAGLNQDEAFSAFEAYSLLTYGVDSAGYHNPVYFTAWGSGMNSLYGYLTMFAIKLFGLSVFSIRFSMALVGCFSLPACYLLLKETIHEKAGLIALAILAFCPWHIMLSRWGLESNLTPSFVLFSLYFFIKGIKNNHYFILSALFYGLSLYCYSIAYLYVPSVLIFSGIYILYSKLKLKIKPIMASIFILFLLAVPLLLFLLVNKDIIAPINFGIFTIPKLLSFRGGEISPINIIKRRSILDMLGYMIVQNDNYIWNVIPQYGLFFKFSFVFFVVGGFYLLIYSYQDLKVKKFSYNILLLIPLCISGLVSLSMIEKNITRLNIFYMLFFITASIGVYFVFEKLSNTKIITYLLAVLFFINSFHFVHYYFTQYNNDISYSFRNGAQQALAYVEENFAGKSVSLDDYIYYPQLLLFTKADATKLKQDIIYTNYPDAFLQVASYRNYYYNFSSDNIEKYHIYVVNKENIDLLKNKNFTLYYFYNVVVAIRN